MNNLEKWLVLEEIKEEYNYILSEKFINDDLEQFEEEVEVLEYVR